MITDERLAELTRLADAAGTAFTQQKALNLHCNM
jgi:hypothetical protein